MTLICTLHGLIIIGSLTILHPNTAAANPTHQVDALEALSGLHPGFRRGQAKGVCAMGHFTGTEAGAALSTASAFNGESHPVLARFSVGGGNLEVSDQSQSARGLALRMTVPDGEQWQMGNISAPLYFVARPEHFAPFVEVRTPDPDTGELDQEALSAINEAHPETLKQAEWLAEQPIGGSYAGFTYWGVNAFRLSVLAGELTIEASSPGRGGECDLMMFNPLVLPEGVAPSEDPVLHARPGAYAESFGRRVSE